MMLPAGTSVTSWRPARIDVLLLLMTLIWGTNYAIVKHAFRAIDPQAFNAVRMVISSAVFLATLAATRRLPWRGARSAGLPESSIRRRR